MTDNAVAGTGALQSASLDTLVQRAGFIFAGTVVQGRATTMPGIPLTERLALVRVDSVLEAPPLLRWYIGKNITVEQASSDKVAIGEQAVFFADSWIYGDSLALRALAHRPIGGDLTHLRQEVVEIGQRHLDRGIQLRFADAAAVIVGRVVETRGAIERERPGSESEHAPQWREAVIAIHRVLRGRLEQRSVVVLFVGSRHVFWRHAPKLHVGQTGVWILHEASIDELSRKSFVVIDHRDSWLHEELERIVTLLESHRNEGRRT